MKHAAAVLLAASAALLAGCRSGWYSARFEPVANEVRVENRAADGQARVLVTVRGVRRADRDSGDPASVELHARLENLGSVPFRLEQSTLELLSGDLRPFGPARLISEDPPLVAPGAASRLDLRFPMPGGRDPDDVDFSALNLRFTLDFDGEPATTSVQFERDWGHRDPYPVRLGFSYGYVHSR